VLACLLTPRPRLAVVLVSLATTEAGLGIGSLALYKYRLIPSPGLMPLDRYVFHFAWHPLLQAVPVPTTAAEKARNMPLINADRLRGPEITADGLRGKIVVALFGGSTTFDDHPAGHSWPERLRALLGDKYAVINRGMGGYTTAEHVIQTAFYERTKGVTPTCSVYYVGWNDLRSANVANLDPGYANFHLPAQADIFRIRPTDLQHSFSALAIFAGRLLGRAFDTIRFDDPGGTVGGEPDAVLERIFARNVETISTLNRARGIRTLWVGQLMNRAALTSATPSYWIQYVPPNKVYELIQRLSAILQREAALLGDVYAGLPVEQLDNIGFVDEGHFTLEGSRRFAAMLAPAIRENCR